MPFLRRLNPAPGLGGKLLLSFSVFVMLAMIIGLVAWGGFAQLAQRERQVSEQTIPDLVTARRLSDLSTEILFLAQLLVEAESEGERQYQGKQLTLAGHQLAQLQGELKQRSPEQKPEILQQITLGVIKNLSVLGQQVGHRIQLEQTRQENLHQVFIEVAELTRLARSQVANSSTIVMSDFAHLYSPENETNRTEFMMALDQLVDVDFDQLQRVSTLELRIYRLQNLLTRLEKTGSSNELKVLRKEYQPLMDRIGYLVQSVEDPDRRTKLSNSLKQLAVIGSIIDNTEKLISIRNDIAQLNKGNSFLLSRLNQQTDQLVSYSESEAIRAGDDLKKSLHYGRSWLLVMMLITVTAMVLILWLFVYRHLVKRLTYQTCAMTKLAEGDLSVVVNDDHKDELSDMAKAIEVFRRNAIARQQLEEEALQNQHEIKRHRDHLAELVEEQTDQLKLTNVALQEQAVQHRKARAEAEQANQAKTRFLAHMSHEIRTPMNGVLGTLSLLKGTQLDDRQQEFVKTIGYSGEILLDILNDILDYSKIEAGHIENNPVSFASRQLVGELVSLMKARAINKGLNLELIINDTVPQWLLGDAVKIRQILLNLIGNAIKFTLKGSIQVSLQIRTAGNYEFRVTDTGQGIAEDKLMTIFDAFTQAGSNIRQPGTGLGLSISKRLVTVLGGNLQVNSQSNKGSSFYFSLPLETSRSKDTSLNTESKLSQYRVLLVEDNAVNRAVAEGYLLQLGQIVETAETCQQARVVACSQSFDLVLMDINLPDGNGTDLANELGSIFSKPVPVIAVSAHVFREDQQKFLEAGMAACLGKPLRLPELARTIVEVMAQKGTLTGASSIVKELQTDPEELLNLHQLNEDREILGDETVENMVGMFLESSKRTLETILSAEQDDHELIKNKAHELKGAAGSMALPTLQKLAGQIEQVAGQNKGCEQLLVDLEGCYRKSCKALELWRVNQLQSVRS
nr:TMAO reductase system sensor histidine kinase/response regulator TorS [Endozoicomonas sp. OPT23]